MGQWYNRTMNTLSVLPSSEKMPAIGLFGGTFDPIHCAHLQLAWRVSQSLHLQSLYFIPVGLPAHRALGAASPAARLAMVRLAIESEPYWQVDDQEIHKTTPAYSIETIRVWRQRVGEAVPLVWILGADSLFSLPTWHQWQAILELTHMVVVARPDYPVGEDVRDDAGFPSELLPYWCGAVPSDGYFSSIAGGIWCIPNTPLMDVSATDIRHRCQAGLPLDGLLPSAVLAYMVRQRLYGISPP